MRDSRKFQNKGIDIRFESVKVKVSTRIKVKRATRIETSRASRGREGAEMLTKEEVGILVKKYGNHGYEGWYDELDVLDDNDLRAVVENARSFWNLGNDFRVASDAENILKWRRKQRRRCGFEIGDTIRFVRFGDLPRGGKSWNYRDQVPEVGVSVYLLDENDEPVLVGWSFDIVKRPAYAGRGEILGWGSDGEPVVRVIEISRDESFDRE